MAWESVGFIRASRPRERVLRELSSGPKNPKELTQVLSMGFPQVSTALKQLCREGLAVLLTGDRTKGRLYGITNEGMRVIEKLATLGTGP